MPGGWRSSWTVIDDRQPPSLSGMARAQWRVARMQRSDPDGSSALKPRSRDSSVLYWHDAIPEGSPSPAIDKSVFRFLARDEPVGRRLAPSSSPKFLRSVEGRKPRTGDAPAMRHLHYQERRRLPRQGDRCAVTGPAAASLGRLPTPSPAVSRQPRPMRMMAQVFGADARSVPHQARHPGVRKRPMRHHRKIHGKKVFASDR